MHMKNTFLIFSIILLLASCRCDECKVKLPYVLYYMAESDSLAHPIQDNNVFKVYVYYKNGTWDQAHFKDSLKTVRTNWFRAENQDSLPGMEWNMVIDQGISPNNTLEDFENYDYLLRSTKSDLVLKLGKTSIETSGNEGRCACENSKFTSITLNDSVHYSGPDVSYRLW